MAIERDLHDLLYAHDCVIVPRFGGFLTHYRSARLDEQRQAIHPPAKDLGYNRHLLRSDGLLIDHVARREGIGFTQATAVIDGEVDAWHSKINRDGRLELPRIGTFYRDAESNLQFDPDRRTNYLKDAYGLRTLAAVPCAVVAPVAEKKVIALPVPEPLEAHEVPRGYPLLRAAAVVALFGTAVTWWLVSTGPPGRTQWSGFDPFGPKEIAAYSPRTNSSVPTVVERDTNSWVIPAGFTGVHQFPLAESGIILSVDLGQPIQAPTTEAPLTQPVKPDSLAVATRDVRAKYHIIGGCFLQKENAEGMVANLQARGFAASIIDQKGGLFRVAYGSYPDRSLANEALQAVRKEEAPEAWLLVR
jgi:CCDC81-like prokaryotic HU domain 2/CCDC81-like prokaryotic HU domain 1/SPOR domain